MPANKPLQDIELIDCAVANQTSNAETAAYNCGYGDDLEAFETALQDACDRRGIDIKNFLDLSKVSQPITEQGLEITPDSFSQL